MDEQTISTSEESMAPTPAKAKAKRKAKAMPKAKKRSNARRVAEGDGNERGRIAKCARQREERAHSPSMSEQTSKSDHESEIGAIELGGGETSAAFPASSGLIDYATWLVQNLTLDEIQRLQDRWPTTYAELCAGMGSGTMALRALQKALCDHGIVVQNECTFVTETCAWKRKALQQLLKGHGTEFFIRTGDLSCDTVAMDQHGTAKARPTCDLIFMGIACVDISNLSSTPKSLRDSDDGASAKSFQELLDYLWALDKTDRPRAIIIECVKSLMHVRKRGLAKPERGVDLVSEKLTEAGYVGRWMALNAKRFLLPASRHRAWGIFLKQGD